MSLMYDSMTPRGHRVPIAPLPEWFKPQACGRLATKQQCDAWSCPPYPAPETETPNAPALLQGRWVKPKPREEISGWLETLMNMFAGDIGDIAAPHTDVRQFTIGEPGQLRIGPLVFAAHGPICSNLRHNGAQARHETELGGGVLNKSQISIPYLRPRPISQPFSNLFRCLWNKGINLLQTTTALGQPAMHPAHRMPPRPPRPRC